ncbi:MAG: hypothetical protein ACRD0Z_14825 [Acidimicrobiales bacterium]
MGSAVNGVRLGAPAAAPPPPGRVQAPTPQRSPKSSAIPDELTKAWDRPGHANRRAARAKDEFALGDGRSKTSSALHSRTLSLVVVAALALAAVAAGAILLVRHSSHESAAPAAPSAPGVYSAGRWTFTASFPVTPASVQSSATLYGRRYTVTTFSSTSGQDAESVSVFPFPVGRPTGDADAFLRTFVAQNSSPAAVGKVTPGKAARVQGLPALWLASSANGGTSAMFGVVILDGHVAWEIIETGPSTTVTMGFQQALKTFRIADPAKAFTW